MQLLILDQSCWYLNVSFFCEKFEYVISIIILIDKALIYVCMAGPGLIIIVLSIIYTVPRVH